MSVKYVGCYLCTLPIVVGGGTSCLMCGMEKCRLRCQTLFHSVEWSNNRSSILSGSGNPREGNIKESAELPRNHPFEASLSQLLRSPFPASRTQSILTVNKHTPALPSHRAIFISTDGRFKVLLGKLQVLWLEASGLEPHGLDAGGLGFLQDLARHGWGCEERQCGFGRARQGGYRLHGVVALGWYRDGGSCRVDRYDGETMRVIPCEDCGSPRRCESICEVELKNLTLISPYCRVFFFYGEGDGKRITYSCIRTLMDPDLHPLRRNMVRRRSVWQRRPWPWQRLTNAFEGVRTWGRFLSKQNERVELILWTEIAS